MSDFMCVRTNTLIIITVLFNWSIIGICHMETWEYGK